MKKRSRRHLQGPVTNSAEVGHAEYELYRNRMEHEDTLIGQRITWFVSSQAFLLTPYVLLFVKPVDIVKSPAFSMAFVDNASGNSVTFMTWVAGLQYLIAFIGIVSSLLAFLSTSAAIRSMGFLTYDFVKRHQPDSTFEPVIGLTRSEARSGLDAARGLPPLFAIAWLMPVFATLTTQYPYMSAMPWHWPYAVAAVCVAASLAVGTGFAWEVRSTNDINRHVLELSADVPGFRFEPVPNSAGKFKVSFWAHRSGPYRQAFPKGVETCSLYARRSPTSAFELVTVLTRSDAPISLTDGEYKMAYRDGEGRDIGPCSASMTVRDVGRAAQFEPRVIEATTVKRDNQAS